MQKKLIALAVAGMVAAPVAMAQSNVTIYGVVDAFLGYHKTGSAKKTVVNGGGLSGSRIGFRGTEDLGNGLKAVFTLEYGIANDVNAGIGTNQPNARQQFVGLQGGFGTISLGRQYSPGFGVFKFDAAMGASPFSPQSILSAQNGMSITPNNPGRWDNSINWKSANMNGFTAQVIYGLGEKNELSDRRDGDKFGINLDYTNGPLAVGVIYHHQKEAPFAWSDWGSLGTDNHKEWLLGASYDFGAAKLFGSYQQHEVSSYKGKLWNLGVSAPVGGAGSVFLAMAKYDNNWYSRSEASSWALGYTHAMSKRTTLYAAYSTVRNKDWRAIQVVTKEGDYGDNNHNYVLGVRHMF